MSEENYRITAAMRNRIQTIQKRVRQILTLSIVMFVFCIILIAIVLRLSDALQTTTEQVDRMSSLLLEQQSILEELSEKISGQSEEISFDTEVQQNDVQEGNIVEETGNETTDVAEIEAEHKVYLTFDDGPSSCTEEVLDILDRYNVKATFFVIGKEDDTSKEILKQIVERGHSLGMHSYSHNYGEIYASVDNFANDFKKIQDYLYDVTGVESTIYRFPGGSSNQVSDLGMQEFANYLQTQGVTFYDWNISSGDGGSVQRSVQDLVDNCTRDIENAGTSIILLHDSGDKRSTVEALPVIIESILALEDTVILPITEETKPVQHISAVQTAVEE